MYIVRTRKPSTLTRIASSSQKLSRALLGKKISKKYQSLGTEAGNSKPTIISVPYPQVSLGVARSQP